MSYLPIGLQVCFWESYRQHACQFRLSGIDAKQTMNNIGISTKKLKCRIHGGGQHLKLWAVLVVRSVKLKAGAFRPPI
jgi:hypothetical protein